MRIVSVSPGVPTRSPTCDSCGSSPPNPVPTSTLIVQDPSTPFSSVTCTMPDAERVSWPVNTPVVESIATSSAMRPVNANVNRPVPPRATARMTLKFVLPSGSVSGNHVSPPSRWKSSGSQVGASFTGGGGGGTRMTSPVSA